MKVSLREFLEDFLCDTDNLHVVGLYLGNEVDSWQNYHCKTTVSDLLTTDFQDGLFILDCPVFMVAPDVIRCNDFLFQVVMQIVVIVPDDWVPTGC